ncbi:MAG TPA: hypothetical protein VHW23_25760, partial [Kofleriaceae bacterium]|nr:hypothetical protein [Kofleriaceae bacterium]
MQRAPGLALGLALVGCNSLLHNGDFRGPDGDSGVEDHCTPRGLPRTALTGTVFTPSGTLPIYRAMVYAPTAPLADIPDGASGPVCASGSPVATTFTDSRGTFKIEGVPSGDNIPIVIQVGKWRRSITVPSVPECAVTALDPTTTRLPRDHTEGHIPHIALATGMSDNLECIAQDIGIAGSEITTGPTSSGRVRLYNLNGSSMMADGSVIESSLGLLTSTTLPQYDTVMIGCPGPGTTTPTPVATPEQGKALLDFANQGGLAWLSHRSYAWLQVAPAPWNAIGTFVADTTDVALAMLQIDQSSPHGQAFADWALATGASSAPGVISSPMAVGSCKAVDPTITQRVLTLVGASQPDVEMFTWSGAMGGRLVFSDLHRRPDGGANLVPYPGECTAPLAQDL